MTIAIDATETEILQALSLASQFNVSGFIAAFNAEPAQSKIDAGESAVNVALSIAGLFFPPAAVAENYVKIAEVAAGILIPVFFGANPLVKFAPLVPIRNGFGGFISSGWAADKREKLDPKHPDDFLEN